MRILFTTNHKEDVSTVLNRPNFARLNEFDGVRIEFFGREYESYDVVLFMGYDPDVEGVRRKNPRARIGIVDPRPLQLKKCLGADFLLVNGLETRDWFADHFTNIYIYYIYPEVCVEPRVHYEKDTLVIGYHGNKVHLQTMYPYATAALHALAKDHNIELWAIYDVKALGAPDGTAADQAGFKLKCIQWSEEALIEYVPQMDIGVVPNLIPIPNVSKAKQALPVRPELYNEHDTDYVWRFKATSNAGRVFVFGQCGVPVVADMFPSALDVIQDGDNGFVAASAGGWYRALKQLADAAELRQYFARNMLKKFQRRYSVMAMNRGLIEFISRLSGKVTAPPSLVASTHESSGDSVGTVAAPGGMRVRYPMPSWFNTLADEIWEWFGTVHDAEHPGWVKYCGQGNKVDAGPRAGLSMSCLALKLVYMLSLWKRMEHSQRHAWIQHIKHFQKRWGANSGSFQDIWMLSRIDNLRMKELVRRADTRQALVTLLPLGERPSRPMPVALRGGDDAKAFVREQPWDKDPWAAGSHTSHMIVFLHTNAALFSRTREKRELLPVILRELDSLRDAATGCWGGSSATPENRLNGAMKVLSGYAVLNAPVRDADQIIDSALGLINDADACHHVDIVFTLHQCCRLSNHRRRDVERFVYSRIDAILEHRRNDGGFSFQKKGTGKKFYGVKVAEGAPVSDIHGTKLLVWLLVMAADLLGWREQLGWCLPVT